MAEQKEEWEPVDEQALEKDLAPQGEDAEFSDLVEIIDESAPAPVSAEAEPAPEPETENSDRVQKRIDQLTRERREAERREQAKDAELQALTERMAQLENKGQEQAVQSFQERYNQVRADLTAAAEEGDTAQQITLTEQLADMRAEAKVAQLTNNQRQGQAQQQPQAQAQDAPQAAYSWWERNQWFNTPENQAESAYARVVDVQLEQEGFDKNTPSYYTELDNRLQEKFPELYNKGDVKKSKPATAPTGGRVSSGKIAKDGRVQLTKDELSMARELGITSEAQLKAYAKEIQKSRQES
jgi:hypothetical protein|tara:strand:+ start:3786 stop:4679 length:894 start_codon:yes stop_codon:yes gene_type:complete